MRVLQSFFGDVRSALCRQQSAAPPDQSSQRHAVSTGSLRQSRQIGSPQPKQDTALDFHLKLEPVQQPSPILTTFLPGL
jgi:hypothetical protein